MSLHKAHEAIDWSHMNYYQGVYYMTRGTATLAASYYDGSRVKHARRGFYVELADGSKLGPAHTREEAQRNG